MSRSGRPGQLRLRALARVSAPCQPSPRAPVRLVREWKESTLRGRAAHEAALRRLPGRTWWPANGAGRLLAGPWRPGDRCSPWLWWVLLLGAALGGLTGGWFGQS